MKKVASILLLALLASSCAQWILPRTEFRQTLLFEAEKELNCHFRDIQVYELSTGWDVGLYHTRGCGKTMDFDCKFVNKIPTCLKKESK